MSDLLNKASLVVIPSGYKEDTVYSVVPSDGSGDLSFTRASNGTRVNSAGLVEVCPWNLLQYSEDFSNGVWTALDATITTNAATAPNGTTTADKIDLGTLIYSQIVQTVTNIKGAYNFTLYIRSLTGTQTIYSFAYNDVDGLVSSTAFSIGTSWTRIEYNFTVSKESAFGIRSEQAIAKSFYIWGAQLNIGSTAKPYFPTTDRLNVPRLTYQNGGGGCPSLLLEKQSTNLFTYSEQFDNSAWVKTSGSVTANQAISPDGTQNADLIAGEIYQQATQANATTYTMSVFAKKESATTIDLLYIDNVTGFVGGSIFYTYATGAITVNQSANGSVSGQAVDMGNGWIRVIMKYTSIALVTFNYQYIGSGGSYIYGAQLEASAYPTSYIPTTSASATRVADACSKTGISSLIGQSEGVMFAEINVPSIATAGNYSSWQLNDGSTSNLIDFTYYSTGRIQAIAFIGGSLEVNIDLSSFGLTAGNHKIAFAYKLNDYVLYVDGVQVGSDTSAQVPAMSKCDLFTGSNQITVYKQFVLFPTRLTNAELASLTTI
jgi:hypothetical protein